MGQRADKKAAEQKARYDAVKKDHDAQVAAEKKRKAAAEEAARQRQAVKKVQEADRQEALRMKALGDTRADPGEYRTPRKRR